MGISIYIYIDMFVFGKGGAVGVPKTWPIECWKEFRKFLETPICTYVLKPKPFNRGVCGMIIRFRPRDSKP